MTGVQTCALPICFPVTISGGMSYLDGIKKLTEKIFEGIPISVSNPKNIKNGFMSFDEANMATTVGLLFYSLGTNRSYQLDSSKKLIKPLKRERMAEPKISVSSAMPEKPVADNNNIMMNHNKEHIQIKDNGAILTPLIKDKKKGVPKFWSKLSEWF